MKTCYKCGTELEDDALFCTSCGEPQDRENSCSNIDDVKRGYFYKIIHYAQLDKKENQNVSSKQLSADLFA